MFVRVVNFYDLSLFIFMTLVTPGLANNKRKKTQHGEFLSLCHTNMSNIPTENRLNSRAKANTFGTGSQWMASSFYAQY
jgi:hypothetical protein